jgi:hypothetical protein
MATNGNSVDVRAELVRLLLSKIEADPFPSATMMDLVEEILTPEELQTYGAILIDKMQREPFPSIPMLSRVKELVS